MVQLVRSIVDFVIDFYTLAVVTVLCLVVPRYRRMDQVRAAYEIGFKAGKNRHAE